MVGFRALLLGGLKWFKVFFGFKRVLYCFGVLVRVYEGSVGLYRFEFVVLLQGL